MQPSDSGTPTRRQRHSPRRLAGVSIRARPPSHPRPSSSGHLGIVGDVGADIDSAAGSVSPEKPRGPNYQLARSMSAGGCGGRVFRVLRDVVPCAAVGDHPWTPANVSTKVSPERAPLRLIRSRLHAASRGPAFLTGCAGHPYPQRCPPPYDHASCIRTVTSRSLT